MLFLNETKVLKVPGVNKDGVKNVVRFWAERGLIHWEDSADNSYGTISVLDWVDRAEGLLDMLAKSAANPDAGADKDLMIQTRRRVQSMMELAQQAAEQGMPTDPSAVRDLRRRRPVTMRTR